MDIEGLNRTQIILLTLLVSFVTSIATGIVTVSLLEQAPPGITQTINRVVERTVEKVVPTQGAASVVTKETTVVVKEDDLITESIAKEGASIVALYQMAPGTDGSLIPTFIGWGTTFTNDGLVVTDSGIIADEGVYAIKTNDGKSFSTRVLSQDESVGIALLQIDLGSEKYTFKPAVIGDADMLKLGQSVIAFGGKETQAVTVGIVSSLSPFERKNEGTTTTSRVVGFIYSNVVPPEDVRGAPLTNIFGEVVGMSAGEKGTRFVSENLLRDAIGALPKPEEKKAQ